MSTGQAEIPSLADDLGYRALVETVSEREGLLIQALRFTGTALRVPPGFSQPDVEAVDAFGPLPGCSHILLADRQEDDDQVHLIGLVCPDVPTAQTAAFYSGDTNRISSSPDLQYGLCPPIRG